MKTILPILGAAAIVILATVFAPSLAARWDAVSESTVWMMFGALAFALVISSAWMILGSVDRTAADATGMNRKTNGARNAPRAVFDHRIQA